MLKRVLHAANQVITHPETHVGRELTIENTVNDKVDLLKITGDSWQGKTTGAQLMPETQKINTEFIQTDTGNHYGYEGFINIEPNAIYVLNTSCIVRQYDSDKNLISDSQTSGNKFVASDASKYAKIRTVNTVQKLGESFLLNMNEGTVALPWEPYTGGIPSPNPDYPQEIISVGGEMASHGWNLAKSFYSNNEFQMYRQALFTEFAGYIPKGERVIITGKGTPGNKYYVNENFFASFDICTVNEKGRFSISAIVEDDIPQNQYNSNYGWIILKNNADNQITNLRDIQICLTDKPYDKFRGRTIVIPELRAIRDNSGNIVAQDVLYVDRKQKRAWVERHIAKEKITTDMMTADTIIKGKYIYRLRKTSVNPMTCPSICSHYSFIIWGYTKPDLYPCMCTDSTGKNIAFGTTFDTLGEFDEFISANEVYVQYMLAEPTIEELPYTDHLLFTAQYQTNIRFVDLGEHLQPTIEATVKCLGR